MKAHLELAPFAVALLVGRDVAEAILAAQLKGDARGGFFAFGHRASRENFSASDLSDLVEGDPRPPPAAPRAAVNVNFKDPKAVNRDIGLLQKLTQFAERIA